jgi:hypothetical protein
VLANPARVKGEVEGCRCIKANALSKGTMARAGRATVSSGVQPPALTNGWRQGGAACQTACPRMMRLQMPNPTASQKGKIRSLAR